MKRRLCWQVVVLAFLGGLFSGTVASAAGFPEKPVRLIVGFTAGAGIDLEARGALLHDLVLPDALVVLEDVGHDVRENPAT